MGLIIGIIGGIGGTAFSMGEENQRINDTLISHTTQMMSLRTDDEAHERATQKELDRLAQIIAAQMTVLQTGLTQLTITVGDLRTDVHVIKALMERMESDLKDKSN